MSTDPFKHAEEEYFKLRGQLAMGRITNEQYLARLQNLIVHDPEGRYWMIGSESGKWHVYDGANWIEATPPAVAPSPAVATPPQAAPMNHTQPGPYPPQPYYPPPLYSGAQYAPAAPKPTPARALRTVFFVGGLIGVVLLIAMGLWVATGQGMIKLGGTGTPKPAIAFLPTIPPIVTAPPTWPFVRTIAPTETAPPPSVVPAFPLVVTQPPAVFTPVPPTITLSPVVAATRYVPTGSSAYEYAELAMNVDLARDGSAKETVNVLYANTDTKPAAGDLWFFGAWPDDTSNVKVWDSAGPIAFRTELKGSDKPLYIWVTFRNAVAPGMTYAYGVSADIRSATVKQGDRWEGGWCWGAGVPIPNLVETVHFPEGVTDWKASVATTSESLTTATFTRTKIGPKDKPCVDFSYRLK